MSALAKMLSDMLLKELPDEVRDALTPENFAKVQGVITGFIQQQNQIHNMLAHLVEAQEMQRLTLESFLDDNRSNSGNGGGDALPLFDGPNLNGDGTGNPN